MAWQPVQDIIALRATEQGALVQDWGGKLPIVLAYANSYSVGMSSLAVHSLYRWFNALPGVVCERAFAWLGQRHDPNTELLTLETQKPVREAVVLAVSLSFEPDYLNLLTMLDQAGIPRRAAERDAHMPIVLLGGPAVSANPEPLALVADAVVIGEIEPVLGRLVAALQQHVPEGRQLVLKALAELPGLYVPALHQRQPVHRLVQPDLDAYLAATSIDCPRAEFGDLHLVEISRGCSHACRFCLAGCWYLPERERSLAQVMEQVEYGTRRGKRIGLVSAAVSDYGSLEELLQRTSALGARLSVSSLRVNTLSAPLLAVLAASGDRTLTMAPEAGSERLRQVIHKGVSEEDLLRAARLARQFPFETVKLYFMIGLPGETDADLRELVELAGRIRQESAKQVVVNVTPFVPKAHTAWQCAAMASAAELTARLAWLRSALRTQHLALRSESVRESVGQALLARGDRALGQVLLDEPIPSISGLARTIKAAGIDPGRYLGEQPRGVELPWHFIKRVTDE